MENKFFYVYEWIRLDTNEPFYVGKGHGNRAYYPLRNKYFNNIVNKIGSENLAVSFLREGLDEKTAFEYEIYYIALYRDELGFNLTNLTDGGTGGNVYIYRTEEEMKETRRKLSEAAKNWSEESRKKHRDAAIKNMAKAEIREKISKSLKGRPKTLEHKMKVIEANKKKSKEMAKKISKIKKGVPLSDSHKKKLSEAKKFKVIVILPNLSEIKFDSLDLAAIHLGISKSMAQKICQSEKPWYSRLTKNKKFYGTRIIKDRA